VGSDEQGATYLGFFTLVFFTGFAIPPFFPVSLSLLSAAVFLAFFAFFAFGLLAVSSTFDGPHFRIFEVGGGEATGFLTTAAGFLRGGMVRKCGVGLDLGGSWGGRGMDLLTWHSEGLEVLWARNFTRRWFVR
jgi:hypothetical protein